MKKQRNKMKVSYSVIWQHMLTINLTSSGERKCSSRVPSTGNISFRCKLVYLPPEAQI